jgi:hypothetical protein
VGVVLGKRNRHSKCSATTDWSRGSGRPSKAAALGEGDDEQLAASGQTELVETASAGGIACRVQMIGGNKAQVTVCVERGTAGQALAPCDLVARNLWHSKRKLQLASQPSTPTFQSCTHAQASPRRPELASICLALWDR